ncbi:MAG: type II toxin-antitoxin system VapC family toxin [Acidobacteriota bacterium]
MRNFSRLLLDTHIFLWWRLGADRIRAEVVESIREAEVVYLSAASLWEISIKSALGRLELPAPASEGARDSGFTELPITFRHAEAVAALPLHHRDPFDRMLVAQSQVEELTLVTRDRKMRSYDVEILGV